MRVVKIDKQTTENILSDLFKRSPNQYDSYADSVQEILDAVKAKGDEALFGYTEKFDGCRLTPETLQVTVPQNLPWRKHGNTAPHAQRCCTG